MTELGRPIDKKMLREFGLIMAGFIAVLFGLLIPWLWGKGLPLIPWLLSGGFLTMALVAPMALKPVFSLWMKFGAVMQKITNTIILGFVFFVIVTPFGWVRRLAKKDSLDRTLDPESPTYRVNVINRSSNMRNPY